MGEFEMNNIIDNIVPYYQKHGWSKTLKLINQIQQKKGDAAQQVLKRIEDLVADSGDGDFIYLYAKDVEGADLRNLIGGLNSAITAECNLHESWDSSTESYKPNETSKSKRWEKYLNHIDKMIEKSMPKKHFASTKEMKDFIDSL